MLAKVDEEKLIKSEDLVRSNYTCRSTMHKMKIIRERLKVAEDRQKIYAIVQRKDLEFEVGDWVFMKLSLWKGVLKFGKQGKLNPS